MKKFLLLILIACSGSSFAGSDQYKYQCDLDGTKSEIGEIVTVFLENGAQVVIQCRVPLLLDFKGEATYKIKANEAQWVLFGPHAPSVGISGPHKNKNVSH